MGGGSGSYHQVYVGGVVQWVVCSQNYVECGPLFLEMALHAGRIVSHAGCLSKSDGGEAQRNGAAPGQRSARCVE